MATYRYNQNNDVLTKYDPITKTYQPSDAVQYPPARRPIPITSPDEVLAIETPHRIAAVTQQRLTVPNEGYAPLDYAKASLYYSSSYIVAAAMITVGLILLAWIAGVASFAVLFYGGLIAWGMAVLFVLHKNRMLGLWHSASGIAHHEIESRERVALHAIDKHVELLKARYGVQE